MKDPKKVAEIKNSNKYPTPDVERPIGAKSKIYKKDPKKVAMGKKSKAQGGVFEGVVRKDLEKDGWIVDRWSNQVEWPESNINLPSNERIGKLVSAKPRMVFNPMIKRMVPQGLNTGLTDFGAFKSPYNTSPIGVNFWNLPKDSIDIDPQVLSPKIVIGIECKMTGVLDREEKEKLDWCLNNKVFSKILIASKIKEKNRIKVVYTDFEKIRKRMRK